MWMQLSLESHDRDAGELVLASLKLTERLMGIVDSHHIQALANTALNQQPVSSSLQGTAYSSAPLMPYTCFELALCTIRPS